MEHISKLLPAALRPSSELQKQELPLSKSGEVAALEIAIKSPLILNSGAEELKQVLRLIMLKIGIRAANMPGEEEKGILLLHIVSNYGGNRIEEIRLAFDMAIAGKLDCEVNAYENFSCLYFSTIMDAYRRWSIQEIKQIEHSQLAPMPPKPSKAELDQIDREYEAFLKTPLGQKLKGGK